ncbi:hypothetical protein [Gymnodinialimonas sp. 57CJ19]|uniref:hypothetical protein n=1 Tax=Gymnodinialimonas sp. 57CJ19 TaxID=3138498 RepID=UPI003134513F
MADRNDTTPASGNSGADHLGRNPVVTPSKKPRTSLWVGVTIAFLAVLQFGPSLAIIVQRDMMGQMDWAGYIGYQLGSLFVPLVIGCLGLLFRRNRGLGYFVVSFMVFVFASLGSTLA